jgi:hypothetical protein
MISDILLKVAAMYCVIIVVWFLSTLLAVSVGWERKGFFLDPDQSHEAARDLFEHPTPIVWFSMVMYVIAFFYYYIPIWLYERYVKHNLRSTPVDPRGKHVW